MRLLPRTPIGWAVLALSVCVGMVAGTLTGDCLAFAAGEETPFVDATAYMTSLGVSIAARMAILRWLGPTDEDLFR